MKLLILPSKVNLMKPCRRGHRWDQIVFVSNREGNEGIYIMNSDGSNWIKITDSLNDGSPTG